MALPTDLKLIRVTYSTVDAVGTAMSGTVTFQLSSPLYDRANKVVVQPTLISVPLVAGVMAVDLPATDDPDLTPRNNFYTVTITLAGVATRTFTLLAPCKTVGAIDLSDVIPVVVSEPDPIYLQLRLDSMQDLDLTGLGDGYQIAYDGSVNHWKVVPAPPVGLQTALLRYNPSTQSYPVRPAGVSAVIWLGQVTPNLAQDGDVWIQIP